MVQSSFNEPSNPNNLMIVGKFHAFIVAFVLALRPMLGGALHTALQALPGWRRPGSGMPQKEGPSIFVMQVRLLRNTDVLDPAIFGQRHFA